MGSVVARKFLKNQALSGLIAAAIVFWNLLWQYWYSFLQNQHTFYPFFHNSPKKAIMIEMMLKKYVILLALISPEIHLRTKSISFHF